MRPVTTKILKMLLFLGMFIFYIYYNIVKMNESFSIETLFGAIAFASIIFLCASLYGFTLDLTLNYIIAFVISIAVILFICFNLDSWIAAIPFLTEDIFLCFIIGVVVFMIIRDIIFIRNFLIARYNTPTDIYDEQ